MHHQRMICKAFFPMAGMSFTDEWQVSNTPVTQADCPVCWPRRLLRHAISALSRAGVPSARIHYGCFGPADEFLVA